MDKINGQFPALIVSMMKPELYDHAIEQCQLIETHISWVILTGPYAYKIKKPVNLGFLDFSVLEKRHFYCDEELRLNRRLAKDVYLAVVPITGSTEYPCLGGKEDIFEYAVKMVQFPHQAQLDRLLDAGKLGTAHIDMIAKMVADFHQDIAATDDSRTYGSPDQVMQPVIENFTQIRAHFGEHIDDDEWEALLDDLQSWSEISFITLKHLFEERKDNNHIRECHGDLHLRNLAWVAGAPLAFDCIEFNPELRWIDVISEIAFLMMDLQARQQPELAQRFLNKYLEYTGDYAGTRVLTFYLTYRAMVRAKIDAIRICQKGNNDSQSMGVEEEMLAYFCLAKSYTLPRSPKLIITRGMSASGKTTLTEPLLEKLAAIRIRSDVERKRLHGIPAEHAAGALPGSGIYSDDSTQNTYLKLVELAGYVIDAGYSVIIDATCQTYDQRKLFHKLASVKRVPYIILDFTAPAEILRDRIVSRERGASDADIMVLEYQISHWQELRDEEVIHVLHVDTEKSVNIDMLTEQVTARL